MFFLHWNWSGCVYLWSITRRTNVYFILFFSCQEFLSFTAKANLSNTPRSGMTGEKNPSHFIQSTTSILIELQMYLTSIIPSRRSALWTRISPVKFFTILVSMLWFLFLFQAARTVLHSAEPVSQMLNDWKQIDFEGITRQALWTFSQSVEDDYELVNERKWTKPVVACVTVAPVTPANSPVGPVFTHEFDVSA